MSQDREDGSWYDDTKNNLYDSDEYTKAAALDVNL